MTLFAKIFMDPTIHELQLEHASETLSGRNIWQNHVCLTLLEVNISVLMPKETDRLQHNSQFDHGINLRQRQPFSIPAVVISIIHKGMGNKIFT